MEIKRIETYSLYEFCQSVQQAVIEGWRFDFESNELFPTAFGSMLVTGMVKPEVIDMQKFAVTPVSITEVNTQDNTDNTESKSEVKRGRKSKDNI